MGIMWGTKMTKGVGGQSHPQPEILALLSPGLGFRMELKTHLENRGYGSFVGQRSVGDSKGFGFWFVQYGFRPITICIKMGY